MRTLVLWLDAFRRDYLTEENTPFLHSLGERFGVVDLKPVLGYSSIAASFYTGRYPATHDQFTIYRANTRATGDWLLRYLPPNLGGLYFNLRRFLSGSDNAVPTIPFRFMRSFGISQARYFHHPGALPTKTIFDVFRDRGVAFLLYNWPIVGTNEGTRLTIATKPNDSGRTAGAVRLLHQERDVYFMHLWDLDKVGHAHGPRSQEVLSKAREQDRLAERIVSEFSLDSDNVIIWSDHGLLDVKETLDVVSVLPPFGDGYLYFLDSTMARFWFSSDARRREVLDIFRATSAGHVITNDERHGYHIDFPHDDYGELIFLANPSVLLLPNFFQQQAVKGMHGYDVSDRDEWGILLANRKTLNRGETVDLMPTILAMMRLIKEESDGRSLLC